MLALSRYPRGGQGDHQPRGGEVPRQLGRVAVRQRLAGDAQPRHYQGWHLSVWVYVCVCVFMSVKACPYSLHIFVSDTFLAAKVMDAEKQRTADLFLAA